MFFLLAFNDNLEGADLSKCCPIKGTVANEIIMILI